MAFLRRGMSLVDRSSFIAPDSDLDFGACDDVEEDAVLESEEVIGYSSIMFMK